MDQHKICFILCSNNEFQTEECRLYIDQLEIPEGFCIEIKEIHGAKSMTSGYNMAMKQTDAKYKVYLHQDVLIVHRTFLQDILEIFTNHPEVGMIGMVGNKSLAEDGCLCSDGIQRRIGEVYIDLIYDKLYSMFAKAEKPYQDTIVLDGLLMATQYDLPWREDLFRGWDFYDCSQSMEFWRAGYRVVVPYMEEPWCLHDNDILNLSQYESWRRIFEREYKADYMEWMKDDCHTISECETGKALIYQIFEKKKGVPSFPYPPVYKEKNVDYICLTNDGTVQSKYWDVQVIEDLSEETISEQKKCWEDMYDIVKELRQDQIQMGPMFESYQAFNPIITVPTLKDFPDLMFDPEKLVPTSDENGTYQYKKNPVYTGGRYNGRKLLLTIGVPVSNQIATIERCLSHIQPLLKNLPAELLVINTGSTDGTIEVCKKYGARMIDFPWCDNMSAARNTGIYNAKGEWYLSIDDDEWFEDVNDILGFFLTGDYKKADMATYIQRNYRDNDGKRYGDSHVVRMARITPELHFEGRIHDALILPDNSRCYKLGSYAHHYGFAGGNIEATYKKYCRNASGLLKDMYEFPEELRYNYQFGKELNIMKQNEKALAVNVRGLAIERECRNTRFAYNHAMNLLASYYNDDKEELFPVAEQLLQMYDFLIGQRAFIAYMQADLGLTLHHASEEILQFCQDYWKYKKEFDKDPIESQINADVGIEVCTNDYLIQDVHVIEFCAYCEAEKWEEALQEIQIIDMEQMKEHQDRFCQYFLVASDEVFITVWKKFDAVQAELWMEIILDAFFNKLFNLAYREKLIQRFPILLQNWSIEGLEQCLERLNNGNWKFLYEVFGKQLEVMQENMVSIQEQYFYAELLKHRFLDVRKDETALAFFQRYVKLEAKFAESFYKKELLENIDENSISGEVCACYELDRVFSMDSTVKEKVRHLRLALEAFPGFKEEIQMILNQITKPKDKKAEMAELAEKLKQQVTKMMQTGQEEEAKQILEELKIYFPEDVEIKNIYEAKEKRLNKIKKMQEIINHVSHVHYHGVYLWKYIEEEVINAISLDLVNQEKNIAWRIMSDEIPDVTQDQIENVDKLLNSLEKRDVLFASIPLRRPYEGKLVHTALDAYPAVLDWNQYQVLEKGEWREDLYTKNIRCWDFLGVVGRYGKDTVNKNELAAFIVKNYIYPMEKAYGFQYPKQALVMYVMKLSCILKIRKACVTFWCDVIDRVKPKVICYTHGRAADLCFVREAAQKKGIPTVEIVHGCGTENLLYPESLAFADYQLEHSELQTQIMRKNGQKNVYTVGKPGVYRNISQNRDKNGPIVISVISSLEKHLLEKVLNLAKRLDKKKYLIVYKMHGSEVWSADELESVSKQYENWRFAGGGMDVRTLYEISDIVIGTRSSGVLDALPYYNIKVLAVADREEKNNVLMDTESYLYQLESLGDLIMVKDDEQLYQEVVSYERGKEYRGVINHYWPSDSEKRFRDFIQIFIDGKRP